MLGLSDIADRIVQSTIRTMSVECEKVGGVNLAQGVCDTEVPEIVRHAAEAAIEAGYNQYTRADGIARLREAVAAKLLRQNGITADPETEIVVTSGVTGGFDSACRALLPRRVRPAAPGPPATTIAVRRQKYSAGRSIRRSDPPAGAPDLPYDRPLLSRACRNCLCI